MLTGEGVGMALAHDLSPLLRTVTFYSPPAPSDHTEYQAKKLTNTHLPAVDPIPFPYLLAFIFLFCGMSPVYVLIMFDYQYWYSYKIPPNNQYNNQ